MRKTYDLGSTKNMGGIGKLLLWLILGGMVYYAIEGLWRIPSNGGWANVSMLFVGGLCFVLIGRVNQLPRFYHLSMRWQTAIGACIVLVVELIAGIILNICLGLGVWDYSNLPLNLWGQVSVLFFFFFAGLMPFAIWLEDKLEWIYNRAYHLEGEAWEYSLWQAYRELLIGKGELNG